MTNDEIKKTLIDKDILYLYHANTVITALTYINNGGLLSRGAVEDKGLYQSEQETDQSDKNLGIYHDIFFDSVDIHKRSKNVNNYGPIVFVYSIDFINQLPEGVIKITKDNPIRWDLLSPESEKYFDCLEDLQLNYTKGNFAQHFTITHQDDPIPFKYLKEIIIDNPEINNTEYFDMAVKEINTALEKNNISVPLHTRSCPADCKCKSYYKEKKEGYVYYRFRHSIDI